MFLVLMILLSITLGAVSAVGVLISGLSGEPSSKVVAKAICMQILILVIFIFFR